MSFKTQIEDLIGSVGDDDLISSSIQDIGAEIIDVLPVEKLLQVAKTTAITDSGLTTAGKKVLAVDKGDLAAREIPAIQKAKFNDTTSIYAASDTDPVYYLEDEKVYVNGAAGSGATSGHLHYVPKIPTTDGSTAIVHGSSTVANFPQEAERLLVLGGSVRCLQRLMADKTASLPTDISAPSLPVSPSTPSSPSFTYTNASVSDITQPLISISDMADLTESAPSYVSPVTTLQGAPTISDLSITATVPVAPALTNNSEVKKLSGDLQTSEREMINARKQTITQKFKTNLDTALNQIKDKERKNLNKMENVIDKADLQSRYGSNANEGTDTEEGVEG